MSDRCENCDTCACPVCGRNCNDMADRIEALEAALRDAESGLRYIRRRYGALEGVGWGRVLPPEARND
jgi:hypothetical protein